MFEYIKLKNFKSFGEVYFNLLDRRGNPKKLILLYGENGVGKSNIASSFFMLSETLRTMDVRDIMQSLLADNPDSLKDETFSRFIRMRYKDLESLIHENKMANSSENMYLEFGFRLNGKSGKYILETSNSQLVHEKLEYVLEKNRGTYFDLTNEIKKISSKAFLDKKALRSVQQACEMYWGKHSLLSILLHESDDKADEYVKEQISENFDVILDFFSRVSCKVKFGSRQERGIIGLPREIFGDYDEGKLSIEDELLLDKTEKMLNAFFPCINRDVAKAYYKRTKKEDYIHYQLMLSKIIAGQSREIPFSMESTGTQSLLQLLPFMLVTVKGSTAIIDEFDTGVHDLLVKNLVQSLYETISGQLIMTTHSTLLMESAIPKECIYVINETDDGFKEINCITHYDKKIHANTNIRNQYFDGKYNGIPVKSKINFSELLNELSIKE